VVKALDKYNAVDVAIPSADTIIAVEGKIIEIPDRIKMRRGQTRKV
jgi:2-C-methyl-D-erythritol 4-phosphate cytidylyltransferase